MMGIADALKPSSAHAVRALQRLSLEVVMLTGDNRRTAEVIAREAGIKQVFAEVRPDQKASVIAALQRGEWGSEWVDGWESGWVGEWMGGLR